MNVIAKELRRFAVYFEILEYSFTRHGQQLTRHERPHITPLQHIFVVFQFIIVPLSPHPTDDSQNQGHLLATASYWMIRNYVSQGFPIEMFL
jgi:hypothetical protein